ncbi:MAG TPA: phosphoglycerate kinase [Candidatus Saccharimonadales bacterium]|nr:phosphoglycerate kinase [Candidatus Saccharimonadales bacterium]
MFKKKTVKDIDVANKKIVIRLDWNVPGDDKGEVTDDFRIKASLPTLNYLLEKDCSIVILSHRGRPENHEEQLSLEPVARKASQVIGRKVGFVDDLVGETAQEAVAGMGPGDVLLLQNTRFYPEEKSGDEAFAKKLAGYGEIFVFDAFAVAHRNDTSAVGIDKFLPSVAGFLVENEISQLSKAIDDPKKPVLAITGGAKLETKLPLLDNFMLFADNIVVAGVMANILLFAQSYSVGKSVFDQEDLSMAEDVLRKAKAAGVRFVLPFSGVAVGKSLDDNDRREITLDEIEKDDLILDFGQKSLDEVKKLISQAHTIIWNGPLGYYENSVFAEGSKQVAKAISESDAVSIVGGGDTADVVNSLGIAGKFTHVSTGGGASLDFMSGKKLPGIEALLDK